MHVLRLSLLLFSAFIFTNVLLLGQKPELVIPVGHSKAVNSFDFSSTSEYLLSGGLDGVVKLWKTETGQELQYYCGPKGYQVSEAILSPDNQKVIIGANDGAVFIFETFTGKALFTFSKEDLGMVTAVAISPDGTKVWSAHETRVVYWDINSGQELFRSASHQNQINDLAISSDGKTGVSVGNNQEVFLWDLNLGQVKQTLRGHQSDVVWTSFVNNGTLAVSASVDNTIIYWDPQSGAQQKQFQIPQEDPLVRVAISEDNQYLLTRSNSTSPRNPSSKNIRLWSITETGLTIQHALDGGITDKAIGISPNQKWIMTGSGNTGVTRRWGLQNGDFQIQFESHAQGIQTTYLTEDKLVAVSHDIWGSIKVFDLNQNKNITAFLEDSDSYITASAISEDGQLLLVNQAGSAEAPLFDLNKMQAIKPFKSTVGEISSLDLSRDKKLVVTSTDKTVYLWNLQTGNLIRKFEGHEHKIRQISISPDQRFLISSSSASSRLWDLNTGEIISKNLIPSAKFPTSFKYAFSPNSQFLGISDGLNTVNLWNLNTLNQTVSISSESPGGFSTFYFSKDSEFLFAGEWNGGIQIYKTEDGEKWQSFVGYGNQVRDIKTPKSGDFILSTSEDQTLKILKFQTSARPFSPVENGRIKEVAQLISLGTKDWAIVTPEGLFDASPGAMDLMYFVVPGEKDYEVIELEQLKSRYRDPGLLQKILGKVDEPIRNVEGLREVALHPEVSGKIVDDQLQLQLQERSGKIGRISVFINGKEVAENISASATRNNQQITINFDLQPHVSNLWADPNKKNIVSVEVTNQEGWLKSKRLQLVYPKSRQARGTGADGTAWTGSEDPTMYIISVGTADYTDTILDLRYAERDASAMAKALYSSGKQLFDIADGVEAYCLTTKKDETLLDNTSIQWSFPSKENIQKTFQQVKNKAKAEDVVVVYFAGHGLTFGSSDQVQFYYLTQAFANEELIEVADTRKKFAISSNELTEWLKEIPALKQVLIIDACNSGNVVKSLMSGSRNLNSSQIRAIDRMQDRTGMFILSGSAANKVSYESSEFGQGLLTYSLLNGMRQGGLRVDQDGEKLIDVIRLFNHARDEVPELAKSIQGIQTPTIGFPKEVATVDIGIFNEQVDIPMAEKKPVVINANFLNQKGFRDNLKVSALVRDAFQKESNKGKDANFLFFPVDKYPGAYQVSGGYKVLEDGSITLTVNLDTSDGLTIELPLKPSSNTKILVKRIIGALNEHFK
ncbi:MAG: hypothetical protein Sapg2KO_32080 [Saprospiraceae bacterium]